MKSIDGVREVIDQPDETVHIIIETDADANVIERIHQYRPATLKPEGIETQNGEYTYLIFRQHEIDITDEWDFSPTDS